MDKDDFLKQDQLDNFEPEWPELEPSEPTWRERIFKVIKVVVAVFVVAGLVYISGIYQSFIYQRTPANVKQENLGSALDAEEINLLLTVFVLQGDEPAGSKRLKENVERLVENASRVWQQASIRLQINKLVFIQTSEEDLGLFFQDPALFVRELEDYDYETINVFLVGTLNGINGVAFGGLRSVAVADYTTVYDFRVLAHEIGHLLGLSHVPVDRNRLMYQGANGSELSLEEIMRSLEIVTRFKIIEG